MNSYLYSVFHLVLFYDFFLKMTEFSIHFNSNNSTGIRIEICLQSKNKDDNKITINLIMIVNLFKIYIKKLLVLKTKDN